MKPFPALLLATTLPLAAQIPAFPGAEGFGAYATGGRGGDVYVVTSLNNNGSGTLREALNTVPAEGRTIVFAVSGYIPVNSDTNFNVPSNVTIAGQTAPGDGVGLRGGRMLISGSNAVMRHFRIRHGRNGTGGDCLNIETSASNTIVDHISMMFSTDENFSFFGSGINNFTMQSSSSSWGMERHNAGGLWDLQNGSCIDSLWAHHKTRNPKARPNGVLEWINNITFHWRSEGFIMGDSQTPANWKTNAIGNTYISIDDPDDGFGIKGTAFNKAYVASNGVPNYRLYLQDTLFDNNDNGVFDGTDRGYAIVSGSEFTPGDPVGANRYYKATTPFTGATGATAVTPDDALTAYKKVVSSVGPLRLDANHTGPLRDELDTLLLDSVVDQYSVLVQKDGKIAGEDPTRPNNGEQHLADKYGITNNGFGTLNGTTPPTDADLDGMPDFWESTLNGLNGMTFNVAAADHNTVFTAGQLPNTFFPAGTPAGYTYLEEYLHFKAVPHAMMPRGSANIPSLQTVNLAKYTDGFTKTPVYTISNLRNGSVQQFAADGATPVAYGPVVKFTPPAGFSGRAGFDFTVTDSDGSAWTQPFAILVKAEDPRLVENEGFETPVTGNYIYNPGGASWTFYSAGVTTNGSAFTGDNAPAPQGSQVAFLQGSGTLFQTIAGLTPGVRYAVAFEASQRQNKSPDQPGQTFDVTIDGGVISSFEPPQGSIGYTSYSASFTATAASHTLGFVGTNLNGGDNTAFIDRVQVTEVFPEIANPNFASPETTDFLANPSGSDWTFVGQSGVAANGGTLTSDNDDAPSDTQVAFLQGTGSIAQTIGEFVPGTSYDITFSASQRQNLSQTGQTFDVRIDGALAGSYAPPQGSAGYADYSFRFTASAASHTLAFIGTDLNGSTPNPALNLFADNFDDELGDINGQPNESLSGILADPDATNYIGRGRSPVFHETGGRANLSNPSDSSMLISLWDLAANASVQASGTLTVKLTDIAPAGSWLAVNLLHEIPSGGYGTWVNNGSITVLGALFTPSGSTQLFNQGSSVSGVANWSGSDDITLRLTNIAGIGTTSGSFDYQLLSGSTMLASGSSGANRNLTNLYLALENRGSSTSSLSALGVTTQVPAEANMVFIDNVRISAAAESPPITEEELRGTTLAFSNPTPGNIDLTLSVGNSVIGHTYQVEHSPDLTPESWQPLGPPKPGTGELILFDQTVDTGDERNFFRVRITR